MQKAHELFGDCAGWLQVALPRIFEKDDPVLSVSPKIARGENYNGLPYVMLDYPRLFGKEDIFAIRTMFWWGNFISCTLHLRGRYAQQYIHPIIQHAEKLSKAGFQVCIGADEWRHDFNSSNYTPLEGFTKEALYAVLSEKDFIKIAVPLSLAQLNEAKQILPGYYEILLSVATVNYPNDGTGL